MRPTEAKTVWLVIKVNYGGGTNYEVYATEKQANLACENLLGYAFAHAFEETIRR